MASISVEFSVFGDPRFKILGRLSQCTHYDAIGRMADVWRYCIEKNSPVLPKFVIDVVAGIDGYGDKILEAELAEPVGEDMLRIRGTNEKRIAWLEKCRTNASKGGSSRAKRAVRNESGQFVSAEIASQSDGLNPATRLENHQPDHPAEASPSSSTSASSSTKEKDKRVKPSAGALPRLAELWNEHRGKLPKVIACNGTRQRKADARWRERPDDAHWISVIRALAASPFCLGDNDRGWHATFDFLLQPETQNKALEGQYSSRSLAPETRVLDFGGET